MSELFYASFLSVCELSFLSFYEFFFLVYELSFLINKLEFSNSNLSVFSFMVVLFLSSYLRHFFLAQGHKGFLLHFLLRGGGGRREGVCGTSLPHPLW